MCLNWLTTCSRTFPHLVCICKLFHVTPVDAHGFLFIALAPGLDVGCFRKDGLIEADFEGISACQPRKGRSGDGLSLLLGHMI